MHLSGSNNKIVGFVVLEHHPHSFDVIRSIPPVALRFDVTKLNLFLSSGENPGNSACNLASYKILSPARTFMIKQNTTGNKHTVCLAIIFCGPVSVDFGGRIGTSRIKWSCFLLGCFNNFTEYFRTRSKVDFCLIQLRKSYCLKYPHSAQARHIAGIFRHLETYSYITHRAQMIYFVRTDFVDQTKERAEISQVAIVQMNL